MACNLATVAFCARAAGTELGLMAALTIVPIMLLVMVLPISVAGWGLREGAAAALWPVIGASAASGVAASIAFGLVILVASLPGLAVMMAPGRITGPVPAPAPETAPAGPRTSVSGQDRP